MMYGLVWLIVVVLVLMFFAGADREQYLETEINSELSEEKFL